MSAAKHLSSEPNRASIQGIDQDLQSFYDKQERAASNFSIPSKIILFVSTFLFFVCTAGSIAFGLHPMGAVLFTTPQVAFSIPFTVFLSTGVISTGTLIICLGVNKIIRNRERSSFRRFSECSSSGSTSGKKIYRFNVRTWSSSK